MLTDCLLTKRTSRQEKKKIIIECKCLNNFCPHYLKLCVEESENKPCKFKETPEDIRGYR